MHIVFLFPFLSMVEMLWEILLDVWMLLDATTSNSIQQHPTTSNNILQHPTTSNNIQHHPTPFANAPTTPNNIQQHQTTTSNNIRCHSTNDANALLLVLALLVDNTLQWLLICAYVYFGWCCMCWVLMGIVRCCWMVLAVDGCCWLLLVLAIDGCWWMLLDSPSGFANYWVFCIWILIKSRWEPCAYLLYGRCIGYD